MSAAQRVLGTDELLRMILGYIPSRAVRASNGLPLEVPPPNFLLAAAYVNKLWYNVALDSLWANIGWEDVEKGILSWPDPPPQSSNPADIDATPLLVRHARRVRKLQLGLRFSEEKCNALSRIPAEIWTDMGMLRTLVVSTDWSPKHFEASRRFLTPTLSTIYFMLPSCYPADMLAGGKQYWWLAEHEAFFNDLRRAAPSMRVFYLELGIPELWLFLEDRILLLLEEMRNLEAIYVPTFALSPNVVARCAAGRPTIRINSSEYRIFPGERFDNEMWDQAFYNSQLWDDAEGRLTEAPPLLDEPAADGSDTDDRCSPTELAVCLDTRGLHLLIKHSIDIKKLTQLEIALVRVPTIDGLRAALRTIGRGPSPLREFRLTAPDSAYWSPAPGYGQPAIPRLEWATLAPLTACTAMEVFAVVWDTSIVMTEADVDELAHAWPQLHTLHLWAGRPHPSNPLEPLPPMSALATLSRCCPILQRLRMQLSPVMPATVPTGFPAFEHLTAVELTPGVPCADDGLSIVAAHKFLWEIMPVRLHEEWPPYIGWRTVLSREDPDVTSPLNASAWRKWMRDVHSSGRLLSELWREHDRTA